MSRLRQWYLTWRHRYDTIGELATMLDNTQMQARRCAYDLGHCSSMLDSELYSQGKTDHYEYRIFSERQSWWIKVFNPRGAKQYLTEQQAEIATLEREVSRLRAHCAKHGCPDPEEIPF